MMKTNLLIVLFLLISSIVFGQNTETDPAEHAQEALKNMMSAFMSGNDKAKNTELPQKIDFAHSAKLDSWEDGSDEVVHVEFFWNDKPDFIGMSASGNLMVSDIQQEILINYNLEAKTATVIPNFLKSIGSLALKQNDYEIVEVKSLGNYKTILGYKCEQFQIESNRDFTKVWLNRDVGFDIQNMVKTLVGSDEFDFLDSDKYKDLENATMMESTSTNKKTGKINHMKLAELGGGTMINNSDFEITKGIELD